MFFPFGYDQSVFMVGGEMTIKNGAIPYRDFIDTKPPLIFYIYGIVSTIFGHHEWSIRLFDILFHIATLTYFYFILERISKKKSVAVLGIFLYVLMYVSMGFWMTSQAESFALLPSLVAFDFTERSIFAGSSPRSRIWIYGVVTGITCAVLCLLKFTLITVPIGILVYILLSHKQFRHLPWRFLTGFLISLILLMSAYGVYLYLTGSLTKFFEALKWVGSYANVNPLLSHETVKERYWKLFPARLLETFSLTAVAIACFGIFKSLKRPLTNLNDTDEDQPRPYLHLCIQLFLGLVSVLFERKFFEYHYTRVLWCIIPFVSIGAIVLLKEITVQLSNWRKLPIFAKAIRYACTLPILVVIIFYSPAVHFFPQVYIWTYLTLTGKDVGVQAESAGAQYFYKEAQDLSGMLRSRLNHQDAVFLWGNSVELYFFLDQLPRTLCLSNTPFVTNWTPESWHDELIQQLQLQKPKIFVCEFGDERPYLTGDTQDSWTHLQSSPALKAFVDQKYHLLEVSGHFKVFERIDP